MGRIFRRRILDEETAPVEFKLSTVSARPTIQEALLVDTGSVVVLPRFFRGFTRSILASRYERG